MRAPEDERAAPLQVRSHKACSTAHVLNKVLTIARFTLLEAVRTRLLWVVVVILVLLFLASLFVQHISVTETVRMQTGFLAASARMAAVLVLSLHLAGSMVREFNDKGVDLLLSLALPRAGYYIGKFLGFAGIAIGIAALTTLALLPLVPNQGLPLWGLSLAMELILVSALTLFCVITFAQIMPAISFVVAFYLLARSINAVRLLSTSQLLAPNDWTNRAVARLVDALAWLLPDLDRFASTAWLLDRSGGLSALGSDALQTLVYGALLLGAGLFDLYRKNL
jgi:ABC-type transport system involved in multi-copper enzyme maturation permease subunit